MTGRTKVFAVSICALLLGTGSLLVVGRQRGLQIARHDHSSPSGIWARGLVVSNRWGEPRVEFVYRSSEWKYGLATFSGSGTCRFLLGIGSYPTDEPDHYL